MKKTNLVLGFMLIMLLATSTGLMAQTSTPPSNYATSDGSSGDPYLISSLDNLYWLTQTSSEWDKHYNQTVNIDASSTHSWDDYKGFSPIGVSGATEFTGSYNGVDYTISGLRINRGTSSNVAMFGVTNNATINNLDLTNVNITGNNTVAALVGSFTDESSMSNCYSTGTVSASINCAGGLIAISLKNTGATCNNSIIDNCYSECIVSVSSNQGEVGGFICKSDDSTIINCYSTGNVTGATFCGGFVHLNGSASTIISCYSTGNVLAYAGPSTAGGFAENNKGTIEKSYCTGTVYSTSVVGGFISQQNYSSAKISNCYSKGSVASTPTPSIGGFCGLQYSGTIENCYSLGAVTTGATPPVNRGFVGDGYGNFSNNFFNIETSGQATSVGATGKTTAEMQTQSTFTNEGWDFSTIWDIDGNNNNDGYPYLQWQSYTNFPAGQGTDVGDGIIITPSAGLNNAIDQTIPPVSNQSFTAGYENVFIGEGIITISISTGYQYGAYYSGGSWNVEENSGGIVSFTNINFDARGDVPIILGDDNPLPVALSSFYALYTGGTPMDYPNRGK